MVSPRSSPGHCLSADRPQARTRLLAYANGYPARLREALLEAFPAVEHVVGPLHFIEASLRYGAHVPPGGYNLSEVGSNFPEFVADDELGRKYAFLADLARLERAVLRAFHARQHPPFDASVLVGWEAEDWQHAVLSFQPALALVCSQWPVADVWDVRETPIEEIDVDLEGRPQQLLVRREGFAVVCDRIDSGEAAALEALLDGHTLGAVIEQLASADGDADEVGRWFGRWSQLGLVVDCRRASCGV